MGLAEEQHQLEKVAEDLTMLRQAVDGSREFVSFLRSPIIAKEKKKTIFTDILRARSSQLTLDFVFLLTDKGREDVLGQIVEQFFLLRDEKLGIVRADVRAATELSAEQHQTIEKRFESITKKKVSISFSLDKLLKGGFIARIGDTVFDGSVRRQLELLRERFAEGAERN